MIQDVTVLMCILIGVDFLNNNEKTRKCKVCGQELPITEFYKHAGYPDTKCKKCAIKYTKEYNKQHREEKREYRKKYYQKNKEHLIQKNKEWVKNNRDAHRENCRRSNKKHYEERLDYNTKYRKNNPDKYYAHGKISSAIQQGKIIKPNQCEICGAEGRVEAHHNDYSKPMEIIWCCKKCHYKLDEQRRLNEQDDLYNEDK